MIRFLFAAALCLPFSAVVCHADILVANPFGDSVSRLDELTGVAVPGWSLQSAGLVQPSGLAVQGNTLYVSSRAIGEVLHYNLTTGAALPSPITGGRDGLFAALPDNPPSEVGGDPELAGPGAIKIGPDGLLYVADNAGANVYRYDPSAAHPTTGPVEMVVASGMTEVGGLGFTSEGDLLISEFAGLSIQKVVDGVQNTLVPAATSGLFGPNGVLVKQDDSFLVADLFSNRITAYDANGANQADFAFIPPEIPDPFVPGQIPGAFVPSNFPSDLTFDAEGNILIAVLGITNPDFGGADNGALLRYDINGDLIETVIDGLSPAGALTLVPGIASTAGDFDRDGQVTAADYHLWQTNFGRLVTPGSNADGNADGAINAADYTIWRDNLPAIIGGTAVPEPVAAGIILLMLSLVCSPRRR